MERAEDDWGEWGTIYLDEGGPPPRLSAVRAVAPLPASGRPAGRPGVGRRRARDVLVPRPERGGVDREVAAPRGDRRVRDRGEKALEAFAYRYPEGESVEERFLVHRTVFPRDFLDEFGFVTVRSHGRVELCRLELGGLVPVEEGRRAKVLRVVQEAFYADPCARAASLTGAPHFSCYESAVNVTGTRRYRRRIRPG